MNLKFSVYYGISYKTKDKKEGIIMNKDFRSEIELLISVLGEEKVLDILIDEWDKREMEEAS